MVDGCRSPKSDRESFFFGPGRGPLGRRGCPARVEHGSCSCTPGNRTEISSAGRVRALVHGGPQPAGQALGGRKTPLRSPRGAVGPIDDCQVTVRTVAAFIRAGDGAPKGEEAQQEQPSQSGGQLSWAPSIPAACSLALATSGEAASASQQHVPSASTHGTAALCQSAVSVATRARVRHTRAIAGRLAVGGSHVNRVSSTRRVPRWTPAREFRSCPHEIAQPLVSKVLRGSIRTLHRHAR